MVNSRLLRLDRFWMPAFQLGLALLTVLCFAPLAPAGAQDATGGSAGKDIEGVKEAVGVGDADVVKPAPEHEPSRLPGSTVEVYGLAMLDMGFQSSQNDPAWFDVIRPTKLPAFENEFGRDGHLYSGVRQSRLGVKAFVPTRLGELSTIFEFELFGVGADAGQTTIRLRHAYGELGQFGAGQTWSPFMDIDGFPNSIEYWGPSGMAFFRNVQVRWMPLKGDSRITLALERPGASGDQGDFADRIELQNISGHFPAPDFSAEGRWGGDWGYVELAGILRYLEWDDTLVSLVDTVMLKPHAN